MGTYLLVDGNSLTYRAFFALPSDMATASGQVTNAVFGFTSMMINVIKDQQPDGKVVAFDRPEPTFRHEAEPEYKAQREAAPDILRQQMGLVREVLEAVGIQQVEAIGWEADDLLAAVEVTSEASLAAAIRFIVHQHRIVIEGSAAAGVAALLDGMSPPGDGPVCVVLTGRNIDQSRLRTILENQ